MLFKLFVTSNYEDMAKDIIEKVIKSDFVLIPNEDKKDFDFLGMIELNSLDDLKRLNNLVNENLIINDDMIEIYNYYRE